MSLAAAIDNGPAARSSRRVHIEAQIGLAEARARKARDRAGIHRRKANGKGGWHAAQAALQNEIADDQTRLANRLRTKLAKDEAAHARRNAAQVKRTAGSTAAAGLVPKTPGHPGQPRLATPGQPAKPAPSKGQPMTTATATVSGEATTLESAHALLANLRTTIESARSAVESASSSLASGGLAKPAGHLSGADDGLDSVLASITEAEASMAPHDDVADAVQAAGEMHSDQSFYTA